MNIGFWSCIVLVPIFALMGIVFGILKGKSAKLVSGFNTLPKEEQERYDKEYLARDMRNSCFLWTGIMLAGAVLSCLVTSYMAIGAYIIWLIMFFKDVHMDARKTFEKYLKSLTIKSQG